MESVYILSGIRTPIGRFGGIISHISPVNLGTISIEGALKKAKVAKELVDLYIYGNVLRAGHGQLLPRQAALKAGIPATASGYAIDMVCSSGMMSVINAFNTVAAGQSEIAIAGGMESMSQCGLLLSSQTRWGCKLVMNSADLIIDLLVSDGLTDPTTSEKMGEQAERLAKDYQITQAELDEIALYSHERAWSATQEGLLKKEIIPIEIKTKQGVELVENDEGIRPETTREKLAKLKPVFATEGVLTAGNSSQISDGAATIVLASEKAVKQHELKPIARIIQGSWAGGEAWRYPEIPIYAVKKLLEKLKMKITDFDLFENNEAFALSSILFSRFLNVPYEKLNVYGGAIALGHPIGASGARIIVTLLNALQAKDGNLGLAAICHGSGGGTAIAIERLQ